MHRFVGRTNIVGREGIDTETKKAAE